MLLAEAVQKTERGQLAQEETVSGPRSQGRSKILHKPFFRAEMEPSFHFFEASALKGTWSLKEQHDYPVQVFTPAA